MQFQENPSDGSRDTAEKVIGPQSKNKTYTGSSAFVDSVWYEVPMEAKMQQKGTSFFQ